MLELYGVIIALIILIIVIIYLNKAKSNKSSLWVFDPSLMLQSVYGQYGSAQSVTSPSDSVPNLSNGNYHSFFIMGSLIVVDSNTGHVVFKTTPTIKTSNIQPPYSLKLQTDGNLVIYDNTNAAVWANFSNKGTASGPYKLSLNSDGTLSVADKNNNNLWSSTVNESLITIQETITPSSSGVLGNIENGASQ